jgi:transposase
MSASYLKPYVKRQKNDATDAEAVVRPTMRFVPMKSEEQQSVLMLHRVRELLIRQRTMLVNALRGHLAEFGIVTRQSIVGVGMLIALVEDDGYNLIPPLSRSALLSLIGQLHEKVGELDRQIHSWHARTTEPPPRDHTRNSPDHCQRNGDIPAAVSGFPVVKRRL